jgi:hypothetical protein
MALLMRKTSALLVAGACLAGLLRVEAAEPSLEYAVKAAYLVKFAPFIDWPESAFPTPAAPLNICVMGADPFGAALDQAAQGQRDGDHPLTIRRMNASDSGISCQIVFAAGPTAAVAADMDKLKSQPVLTVTDSGAVSQGIISFVVVGDHVRFDINEAQADAVGIRISSKLLGLAHALRRNIRP